VGNLSQPVAKEEKMRGDLGLINSRTGRMCQSGSLLQRTKLRPERGSSDLEATQASCLGPDKVIADVSDRPGEDMFLEASRHRTKEKSTSGAPRNCRRKKKRDDRGRRLSCCSVGATRGQGALAGSRRRKRLGQVCQQKQTEQFVRRTDDLREERLQPGSFDSQAKG